MIDLVRLEQAELIEGLGPAPSTPFGLHVVRGDHPAAELGRSIERAVFREAFGNTPEQLVAEYGRYDRSSVFLTVVDHRRRVPAGVMRLILSSPVGYKSLKDVREGWGTDPSELTDLVAGVDPATGNLWDIATLAVDRGYRSSSAEGLVSMALWQAAGVLSCRCYVDLFVAIVDVTVLELMDSHFPGSLKPFPGLEPKRYLDSPASVPVWCSPLTYREHLAASNPELFDFLAEGKGLEPVVAQPVWEDAANLIDEATRRGHDQGRPAGQPIASPTPA